MASDDDLLPVRIFNIYPYAESLQGGAGIQSFLVFLREGEDTDRVVPINIGHFEGQALVMALRRIPLPRPLPHHLLQQVLARMDAVVERLVIHTLKDGVFHADLLIRTETDTFHLDCRPSDGMILATLLETPMFMTQEVMDQAGQALQQESEIRDSLEGEAPASPIPVPDVQEAAEAEEPAGGALETESELTEVERLNVRLTRLIAEEA